MHEEAIRELSEEAIKNSVFPGCVVGVIREDGTREIYPAGSFTYNAESLKVSQETVYDVASITKTIPVGLLAIKFIEEGRLKLDDQIIKYLPEIKIRDVEKGLIRHILTYTYSLKKNTDPNFSYANSKASDIFDFLFNRDFEFLPGTHYEYANTSANLLGIILERISGKKLYELGKEMILDPLEMVHSTFKPEDLKSIPPTEIVSWRGEVQGRVHDETASILQIEGYNPGCAGLFSNIPDILNVAECILDDGVWKGKQMFSETSMMLMTTNALESIGASCAIAWELNQPKFMGKNSHSKMVGKTGFTGASVVIDLNTERALVILSNRTYPKRQADAGAISEFRRKVADIIFDPND